MLTPEAIQTLVDTGEGYNVEFKVRVPQKVKELSEEVCAFANSAGGYVLIGVDDKNNIQGAEIDNAKRSAIQNSIREISPPIYTELYAINVGDNQVWVIDVPSGGNKPYVLAGAIYIREGANTQKLTTAEEMRAFFQQNDRIYFDEIPCEDFDYQDQIDTDNFDEFRFESRMNTAIPAKQVLSNLQVLEKNDVTKRGGVLFFAKHPENYFSQAVVRCVLFKGVDKVYILDDKTFGGPLNRQYQQAMEWIQSKLQVAYDIIGQGAKPRREIWEIPLTVFKEAIINALSHRDYYEKGATTTIEIFDDRVEISNPGGLLLGVIDNFGTKSMSRNPLIFGLFTRMHLVERIGSGVPRMKAAMKEAGLPEPLFHTDGIFTITFLRSKNEVLPSVKNHDFELSDIQKAILELMKQNAKITFNQMLQEIQISRRTLSLGINGLKNNGFIYREGTHRKGKWIVL